MYEQIRKVIAEQLGVDEASITPETSLMDDLKADSLDLASMVLDLEEQYDIEVPDEDLPGLKTVGQVADYIQGRLDK